MQAYTGWIYSTKKYREAMTKEEQCKVPLDSDWGPTYDTEKMSKEYHEYCPKSKSKSKSNFVFCPQQIIKRKKDEKIQWINDYFKNFKKKSRKKKTKKKSGKKKTKKKSKKKKTKKKSKKKKTKKKSKKKKTKKKNKKKKTKKKSKKKKGKKGRKRKKRRKVKKKGKGRISQ